MRPIRQVAQKIDTCDALWATVAQKGKRNKVNCKKVNRKEVYLILLVSFE